MTRQEMLDLIMKLIEVLPTKIEVDWERMSTHHPWAEEPCTTQPEL